ncbi:uncharacterized protein LOC132563634 [Ylistrum balloti]|uniref:uncharacterized protein LOC132563634 n=1 Tax=Ylistrum balloti TaxID=509963 RepID=UPI002905A92F|nr:uncharacterized protein LOC132563634 [Ylistrum balloti]
MTMEMSDMSLIYTRNPVWNDAILFVLYVVHELVGVVILISIYLFRKKSSACFSNYGTTSKRSTVETDHEHLYYKSSVINECTEGHGPRLVPPRGKSREWRQNLLLKHHESNLRRLNNLFNITIDTYKKDEDEGKSEKRKVLFSERFLPVETSIIVYPARQDEDMSSSTEATSNIHGLEDHRYVQEDEENVANQRSAEESDFQEDEENVANQRSAEKSDYRPENKDSDNGSCFSSGKLAEDNTSESLGFIGQSKQPEFEPLKSRLHTYSEFPDHLKTKVQDLATAGFYFKGYEDATQCFFCGGCLKEWEEHDDPWVEHARWFPDCGFVIKNKQKGFVNLVQEKLRLRFAESQRQLCQQQDSYLQQQQHNPINNLQASKGTEILPEEVNLPHCSGRDCINPPVHPQYASHSVRSYTFKETDDLRGSKMAEAGFFYRGHGVIICFNCGHHFTLEQADNLWIEHARWLPECFFPNAEQGQSFVTDSQATFEQLEIGEFAIANDTRLQTSQHRLIRTYRHNNLETSNPQSPTATGSTDHQDHSLDILDNLQLTMAAGYSSHQERLLDAGDNRKRDMSMFSVTNFKRDKVFMEDNASQCRPKPSVTREYSTNGIQTQEGVRVRLSNSVSVEDEHGQPLRP